MTTGLAVLPAAHGQSSVTNSRFIPQGPAESTSSPPIRDALNRPCLDVEAMTRSHAVNRDMIDHVVSIRNNCPRSIKVKVCYYNSETCNALEVLGYKRVDTLLGTVSKSRFFRYTISQK